MKEGERGQEDILWTHCACDSERGEVTRCLWLCDGVLLLPSL